VKSGRPIGSAYDHGFVLCALPLDCKECF
jgi:hypothetical protein